MKQYRQLPGLILLLCLPLMSLSAAEDVQPSDFARELLNNKYMQENLRLLGLAEDSYAKSNYDDAVKYSQESIKYAQMSDDYVSAIVAIRAAQTRLDQVKKMNAHLKYAEIYGKAEAAFAEAQNFRSREQWNPARESALKVISILAEIPAAPVLAAQYRVKTWIDERDCFWNIAGREEIYGDPFKWRVIYNANKNKLPNPGNPNLIEPGTLLDIPSIAGEYRAGILED